MSEPHEPDLPPSGSQLKHEAALWFARMHGPDAEAFRPEFEAWLARGALHLRAYNNAAEIYSDGKFLEDETGAATTDKAPEPQAKWPLVMVGLLLIGIVVVGLLTIRGAGSPMFVIPSEHSDGRDVIAKELGRYSTGPGETRTVRLADGSVVSLSADSQLQVDIGQAQRDLRLERGRARFEVAHDARPFVVRVAGGTVTARGTVFEITIDNGHRVTVNLLRGLVDVSLPASGGDPRTSEVRRLSAGEMVTYDTMPTSTSAVQRLPDARPPEARSDETAARDYDEVRVADIIAEANRGSSVTIRLADPEVAEQKLSGRFRTDDPIRLADRLAALFDLVVDRSDPAQLVLRRR
jgi:transmembrane sensor